MAQENFTFTLPDLGEGLVEATVLEWQVAVGDVVERNAPLVEVETTKSAVVIPSPKAGRIAELHAEEEQVVPVGEPLVTFEVEAADEPQAGIVGRVPAEEARPARRVRLRPPSD
ncbi:MULTISPECIES: biotin/lipoyl-containing protein [Nocardiopsis]|jgi:pyruvate/2-oxoglutarate dehydrogenase complex dihydrolipoamide acyltransferase (E2) component|uniref:Biotin attachment protein n=1 Tax=Nocardiopsis sinuspersici TaxID=501010 RepID=A0A1V3C289_9ACTN|nr:MULTISPECIES: biotin/lipoyl-containing protein [Nocardiopsis]NYH50999.1 pyruvate dehydrogenase E2 component (dihydrolipoamide acetyltransferase) [Nocardiopsis sinuspersici]OOC54803.1 biotin attachment protein [Nocardiopsis sinuspersici]